MQAYGKELILDIHNCDARKFNRKDIKAFLIKLCKLIDMKREDLHWWDYQGLRTEYTNAPAHLKGTSCVQFISTSNIIIHTLDDLGKIFVNIFSCEDFDMKVVEKFTKDYFGGKISSSLEVLRH